jgi:WS/DGAT/MGAT family acyltransferase
MIQKVHHAVTDGVGGIEIALMLLDTERDPGPDTSPLPDAPEPEPTDTLALIRENLDHERRRFLGMAQRGVRGVPGLVGDLSGTARGVDETVRSAVRLLAPTSEPLSPVMRGRSLSCRFDTVSASLPDMKAAAKKAGGRLNDAFLAAVAGGFRRYHDTKGAPCDAIRVSMPINLREADAESLGGNQFAPARFPLPIGIDDPVERMAAIRELVAVQRDEPALKLADSIALVLNRLPTSVVTGIFGGMLKTVDCVVSNVPGLPFEVFLGGARQEAQFAMGPPAGAAVNITLLSYLDEVQIAINSDPAAIPDPDVFVACLHEGIDEIRKVG